MFFEFALLITDGKQTRHSASEPSPAAVASAMRNRGITVVAMGIAAADPIELVSYTNDTSLTVFVQDFSELDAKVLETAEILCPSKLYYDAFMN